MSPVFPTQVPDDPKQDSTGEDSIGQSPANGTDLVKRNIEVHTHRKSSNSLNNGDGLVMQ